jgi:hypothetical protein
LVGLKNRAKPTIKLKPDRQEFFFGVSIAEMVSQKPGGKRLPEYFAFRKSLGLARLQYIWLVRGHMRQSDLGV